VITGTVDPATECDLVVHVTGSQFTTGMSS
jgi:hypothetical protein